MVCIKRSKHFIRFQWFLSSTSPSQSSLLLYFLVFFLLGSLLPPVVLYIPWIHRTILYFRSIDQHTFVRIRPVRTERQENSRRQELERKIPEDIVVIISRSSSSPSSDSSSPSKISCQRQGHIISFPSLHLLFIQGKLFYRKTLAYSST